MAFQGMTIYANLPDKYLYSEKKMIVEKCVDNVNNSL